MQYDAQPVLEPLESRTLLDAAVLAGDPIDPAPVGDDPAIRQSYYVSPAGGTGGTGTAANPFHSLDYAVSTAGGGNTFLLLPGVYGEISLQDAGDGTAEAPTIVRSLNKWEAIIEDAATPIDTVSTEYIRFEGLQVRGGEYGIRVISDDVTVQDCWIHGTADTAVRIFDVRRAVIRGNLIEDNSLQEDLNSAVYVTGQNLRVESNVFRSNRGVAIMAREATNLRVTGNLVIGDANSWALWAHSGQDIHFESNVVVNCAPGSNGIIMWHNNAGVRLRANHFHPDVDGSVFDGVQSSAPADYLGLAPELTVDPAGEPLSDAELAAAVDGVDLQDVYWISPAGSVGADGSYERPWSLHEAFSTVGGGHTFILLPGDYNNFRIYDQWSGTAGDPTVLRAAKRWGADFETIGTHGVTVDASYVTLEGIEATGASLDGIKTYGANITIRDAWVHDNTRQGILMVDVRHALIEGSLIESNGTDTQFDHGIYAGGADITVRGNVIRHNAAYGVHLFPGVDGSLTEGNLIYGHQTKSGVAIVTEGVGTSRLVGNVVVDNAHGNFYLKGVSEVQLQDNLVLAAGDAVVFDSLHTGDLYPYAQLRPEWFTDASVPFDPQSMGLLDPTGGPSVHIAGDPRNALPFGRDGGQTGGRFCRIRSVADLKAAMGFASDAESGIDAGAALQWERPARDAAPGTPLASESVSSTTTGQDSTRTAADSPTDDGTARAPAWFAGALSGQSLTALGGDYTQVSPPPTPAGEPAPAPSVRPVGQEAAEGAEVDLFSSLQGLRDVLSR